MGSWPPNRSSLSVGIIEGVDILTKAILGHLYMLRLVDYIRQGSPSPL